MVKPIKVTKVDKIKADLENAGSLVFTDYRGLDVGELSELRGNMIKEGVTYKVLKNTLAKIAATEAGLDMLVDMLSGPTAVAFGGNEDPIAPARLIEKFAKIHKQLEIKGGYMDGAVLTVEQVQALAKLPNREQLLAIVAGMFQAPIAQMARVLNAPMQGVAVCLKAIAEKQQ